VLVDPHQGILQISPQPMGSSKHSVMIFFIAQPRRAREDCGRR